MIDFSKIEVDTGYEGSIQCRDCHKPFADQNLLGLLHDAIDHMDECPGEPPERPATAILAQHAAIVERAYGQLLKEHLANPHPILGELR